MVQHNLIDHKGASANTRKLQSNESKKFPKKLLKTKNPYLPEILMLAICYNGAEFNQ